MVEPSGAYHNGHLELLANVLIIRLNKPKITIYSLLKGSGLKCALGLGHGGNPGADLQETEYERNTKALKNTM